jgi:hypothetical protein
LPFQEVLGAVPALEQIDVTVAGGSYRRDFAARAEEYRLHRRWGVRAFGTSFHDRGIAAEAMRERLVDIGFIRYNPRHLGAEKDIFPHLPKRPRALLFNFTSTHAFLRPEEYAPLGVPEGHWRPPITDYYRFALARPEIDGLLCSPRTPKQVEALARAVEEGPLTEEERIYMRDLAELSAGTARMARIR